MNVTQKSRILGIVIIVFCIVLWFFMIPTQVKGKEQKIFPRLITVFLAIPSALLIASRKEVSEDFSHQSFDREGVLRVIVTACLFAIYLFIIGYVGFFPASFLFFVVLMAYFGVRSWKKFLFIPVVLLFAIYFIIERLLRFPLPEGEIF